MATEEQLNHPLHGVKMVEIVERLVDHYGWDGLADHININCFSMNPSVKSSVTFIRKTPWAKEEVENLYIATFASNNPWLKS